MSQWAPQAKVFLLYFASTWLTNCFHCIVQGDSISPLVQTSVLGKGVKHRPPPIKMPSGSGSSSSGTHFKTISLCYQNAFVACNSFIEFFMTITTFRQVTSEEFWQLCSFFEPSSHDRLLDNKRWPKLSGLCQTFYRLTCGQCQIQGPAV